MIAYTLLAACLAAADAPTLDGRPLAAWSELLSAPEVSARRFAARTIAAKAAPSFHELLPSLEAALRDDDFQVRKSAVAAIDKIDRAGCRKAAITLAADLATAGARLPAVRALGELRAAVLGPDEIRKLDAAMRAHKDDTAFFFTAARSAAILAPKVYTKDAVKLLTEGLKHPSADVRALAATGLADIGPGVITYATAPLTAVMTKDADGAVRAEAARSLARIDRSQVRKAVGPVIDVLKDPQSDAKAKAAAARTLGDLRALGDFGGTTQLALDRLRDGLKDADTGVRLASASALFVVDAKVAAAEAVPVLNELLTDADKERVLAAVEVLKAIGPAANRAVPGLVAALRKSSDDLPLLLTMVDALGQIGEPAVAELVKLVGDAKAGVGPRRAAIDALAKIGKPAKPAIPQLVLVLKSSDRFLPRFAATALAKIGPDAMPELQKLLKDTDAKVRAYAAQAVGESGPALGRPLIPELRAMAKSDADASVREVAGEAVRQLDATP